MAENFDNNFNFNSNEENYTSHSSLTTVEVRGEISKVKFHNEENNFTIMEITDTQGVRHTAVGVVTGGYIGQGIVINGIIDHHKDFGKQLKIKDYHYTLPVTCEGIEKYLSSNLIQGIGPKLAKQIVTHFGLKTLEILDNYSSRLTEVPGIGKGKAKNIKEAWENQQSRRDIYIFLQSLGVTPSYCNKIYLKYKSETANVLKENPYQIADDIDGIGFLTADKIALKMGLSATSKNRLISGISYILKKQQQNGHCCIPENELIKLAVEALNVDIKTIQLAINEAINEKKLVREIAFSEPSIYLNSLYKAETELVILVRRLAMANKHKCQILRNNLALDNSSSKFSDEQLQAVDNVSKSPLSIITGGPGVGKTTVISEIVKRATEAKLKIKLAAPTGKAAKRLSQSANLEATTIHRLLKFDPASNGFTHNQYEPIKCDLLIVDEVSMLDINLAVSLFKAIKPTTTVVLVGDPDQLPSVGPGEVLHDFINCGLFKVSNLTQIFRQGSTSNIITNAHNVNAGILPQRVQKQGQGLTDFYWIVQNDSSKIPELILKMATERIPQRFKFNAKRDIQILTPTNRGETGTIALNALLQEHLNSGNKPQFKSGDKVYKSGDKVMQISNNYDKSVFNGDTGYIGNINNHAKTFEVHFDNHTVLYEFNEVDQITLAYAVTIHKSQGSEFPVVIMPITTAHYMMLQRNLIYTGMTRAKKLLILIGNDKAVSMAVSNFTRQPRFSNLLNRIKQ
ncbi:ATP-dependent RecD-like DNA helicase [Lentisphaerota bacterium WC36G]|nr:ATP-dependent RecD-like DNA helicase [Lentisphaerae bacterium WC36]